MKIPTGLVGLVTLVLFATLVEGYPPGKPASSVISAGCPAADSSFSVYLPDPNDCSVFYECSSGVAYQQVCPAGLHFSPTSHVCDYPGHAGCTAANPKVSRVLNKPASSEISAGCPAADSSFSVYLPDPNDCSVFYECSSGVAYEQVCPAGLHFSPTSHVCDYPGHAGCTAANPKVSRVLNKPASSEISAGCPAADSSFSVYLPDPNDCSVFYECSSGVAYEQVCPAGLHFSPTSHVCDYPGHAGCTAANPKVSRVLNKPASSEISAGCPAADSSFSVYLPDPNDCSVFYECSSGVAYEQVCPAGLHFSPTSHVCDYPGHAGCTAANPKVSRVLNKPASSEISAGCPAADSSFSVYLPDPNDCSVFYECSSGVAYEQVCPAGLHFSPTSHVCDYPGHAGCTAANPKVSRVLNKPASSEISAGCPAADSSFSVYLPDPNDCSVFYECSSGVAYEQVCPAGLHFSPTSHVCDYPGHAGCTAANPKVSRVLNKPASSEISAGCPAADSSFSVYLPDPNDCSVFYECSSGVAYEQVCPAGLHFSPTSHVCDYPGHAGCTAANPKVSRVLNKPASSEISAGCPAADSSFSVYLPDPIDCSVFYECSSGVAYEQVCPAGLHFSPISHVCDYPGHAGCTAANANVVE